MFWNKEKRKHTANSTIDHLRSENEVLKRENTYLRYYMAELERRALKTNELLYECPEWKAEWARLQLAIKNTHLIFDEVGIDLNQPGT